jgi:acyl carrier protein
MTDLTPRQLAILSALRQTAMLADTVAVQQCADDAAFMALCIYDDIGLDSLEVVELGMEVEEAFGIELADDDVGELETITDIVALIEGMAGK